MKDNFSAQASAYARFRPTYPDEVVEFVLAQLPSRSAAWDCGTGNGQVAVRLSEHFEKVYATDISRRQMGQAPRRENIFYRVMSAEEAAFPASYFDLITVAQAIHWFDFERFYAVVHQVLRPEGVIALLGYTLLRIDPTVDAVIHRLYADILGTYWDPERRYIDEGYRTIPFPFQEIPVPDFQLTLEWSYEQLIGYLNTWSALQHYRQSRGSNPIDLIAEALASAWGTSRTRTVVFPLLLRVGKK